MNHPGMSMSENKKDILEEHMRLLDMDERYDEGRSLFASRSHDDALHILEHKRFKAENPDMGMNSMNALDNHISKHVMSQTEKDRLGLDTTAYADDTGKQLNSGEMRVRTHISPGG